ncbi:MAG: nucleotidyltransferase domain-containing protein [archaeon]
MKFAKKTELHCQFMKVVNQLVKKKISKEPIEVIILGGSVARGDETEESDIDVVFYVKKKDMPANPQRFYKFKGKYIEEHYSTIENLKSKSILPEEKILYDKKGKIPKLFFDEKWAKKDFNGDLKDAKKSQKIAEKKFSEGNYDLVFNYLYGIKSPSFLMMHAIPPRFNLPFPSFRLLGSIRKIDKKHKTRSYLLIKQLYEFENKDCKRVLGDFKKAYFLMNQLEQKKKPRVKNLGFYDKLKIDYNVKGLKRTFEDYPFVYAYRFIVGCLVMWTFDEKIQRKDREIFHIFLLKILGVERISKELVKEKLELSRNLVKECEKLK